MGKLIKTKEGIFEEKVNWLKIAKDFRIIKFRKEPDGFHYNVDLQDPKSKNIIKDLTLIVEWELIDEFIKREKLQKQEPKIVLSKLKKLSESERKKIAKAILRKDDEFSTIEIRKDMIQYRLRRTRDKDKAKHDAIIKRYTTRKKI